MQPDQIDHRPDARDQYPPGTLAHDFAAARVEYARLGDVMLQEAARHRPGLVAIALAATTGLLLMLMMKAA